VRRTTHGKSRGANALQKTLQQIANSTRSIPSEAIPVLIFLYLARCASRHCDLIKKATLASLVNRNWNQILVNLHAMYGLKKLLLGM
jgi:hypothetical protein